MLSISSQTVASRGSGTTRVHNSSAVSNQHRKSHKAFEENGARSTVCKNVTNDTLKKS